MARLALFLPLFLAPALAGAQVYKSVGPDGRVTYSDTPPAVSRQIARLDPASAGEVQPALPYALQQALRRSPVTLYTTSGCAPCDEGRKLLATRGIPHAEKTVSSKEDILALQRLAGENKLPVLAVGEEKRLGFEAGAWQQSLSSAGYPAQASLPPNWRNPAPTPLAPRPAPAPDAPRQGHAPWTAPAPPADQAGIRF